MPTLGVIYLKRYINISTQRNSTHRLLGVRELNTSSRKLKTMFLMNSPQYTASQYRMQQKTFIFIAH